MGFYNLLAPFSLSRGSPYGLHLFYLLSIIIDELSMFPSNANILLLIDFTFESLTFSMHVNI